jgi:hypothetical protein
MSNDPYVTAAVEILSQKVGQNLKDRIMNSPVPRGNKVELSYAYLVDKQTLYGYAVVTVTSVEPPKGEVVFT